MVVSVESHLVTAAEVSGVFRERNWHRIAGEGAGEGGHKPGDRSAYMRPRLERR